MAAETVIRKPMVPQQCFPRRLVISALGVIPDQQIAYERKIMREALMGKLIEMQIQVLRHAGNAAHVGFQISPGKNLHHLLGDALQVLVALLSQVPAGKFLVPAGSRKLPDGSLVHSFFFGA